MLSRLRGAHSADYCCLLVVCIDKRFSVHLVASSSPWFGRGIRVALCMLVITLSHLQKGVKVCSWTLLDKEPLCLEGHTCSPVSLACVLLWSLVLTPDSAFTCFRFLMAFTPLFCFNFNVYVNFFDSAFASDIFCILYSDMLFFFLNAFVAFSLCFCFTIGFNLAQVCL